MQQGCLLRLAESIYESLRGANASLNDLIKIALPELSSLDSSEIVSE